MARSTAEASLEGWERVFARSSEDTGAPECPRVVTSSPTRRIESTAIGRRRDAPSVRTSVTRPPGVEDGGPAISRASPRRWVKGASSLGYYRQGGVLARERGEGRLVGDGETGRR